MTISLEQLSAQMRRGEQVPLRHTMQVVLTLSIPSILQQIVVTAVEYIDAAMVGHIGASATASIGIVSSSTWLMHGMLAGLYMSFAIQVAQYLGGRPAGRRPRCAASVYDLQPCNGPCSSSLWHRHQPFPARVAGGRPVPAGGCIGLFCHLVRFPALFDGHGHLFLHAAFLRRRPDAGPDQRIDLRAGCGVQLLPHQPYPADDGAGPHHDRVGSRLGRAGRGAGYRLCHCHQRHADAGTAAASRWPAVHPQARLLADHQSLPAEPLEGGHTAGRRTRGPFLRTGAAHPHRCPALAPLPLQPTVWA